MTFRLAQDANGGPVLATERLRLRLPVIADFPAFAAFFATDRTRFMGGPGDTEKAWFWFCSDVAQWALFGHGALMIDLLSTRQTIGQVGINAGPLFPETELGWFLYEGFEGQGYATEAAAALRDWAYGVLPVARLVSYMDPENSASVRVAVRLGAMPDPDAPRMDPDDLVYLHRRAA